MPVRLSKQPIISRDDLRAIAETRLREAETLSHGGHYAGAVYLAGYAVECLLKMAICVTLKWEGLRGTFKTHDLEGLLLHSGFDGELRSSEGVIDSFAKIVQIWAVEEKSEKDGTRNVRYSRPESIDQQTARRFLDCVNDPKTGVAPWLLSRIG